MENFKKFCNFFMFFEKKFIFLAILRLFSRFWGENLIFSLF